MSLLVVPKTPALTGLGIISLLSPPSGGLACAKTTYYSHMKPESDRVQRVGAVAG